MKAKYRSLFDGENERRRDALAATEGLELSGGYRGTLQCGRRAARVHFESSESIRVALPLKARPPARAALEATSALSGNVRYARTGAAFSLVADTRVDGSAHLPVSFAEIRDSMRPAKARAKRPAEKPEPIPEDAVRDALADARFGSDDVVELDAGWELRPRISGAVLPVRVECEPGRLRLRRVVLHTLPAGVNLEAVCDEALRSSGEIRLARLAVDGDELVAESCLHAGQIEPGWIAVVARAVAAAFDNSHRHLRVLAENELVARHYARIWR